MEAYNEVLASEKRSTDQRMTAIVERVGRSKAATRAPAPVAGVPGPQPVEVPAAQPAALPEAAVWAGAAVIGQLS